VLDGLEATSGHDPSHSSSVRIAVEPAGVRDWLGDAVRAGGGEVVAIERAEALIWAAPDAPDELRELLDAEGDHLRWVQLPWAGIEPYQGVLDHDRIWTCGKGVYAEPVAELALTLALTGMRGVGRYARSTSWLEEGPIGTNLTGARVVALGAGGITEALIRLLDPFDCRTTVVRRRVGLPVPTPGGAVDVVGIEDLDATVHGADLVVLALALTSGTAGIVDEHLLRVMGPGCHLVNVARGAHVVTNDLVAALADGTIAWAGLDVTDPEPLPDGHPLWSTPNCVITPHVGNTPQMALPLLTRRISDNVRRWSEGRPLLGPVDVDAGY